MDQVELLKIYAVKLASRLGENQESIEFIADSVTDHGIETMIVEVIKNAKLVKLISKNVLESVAYYSRFNQLSQEEIMLVYLYQLRKVTLLILLEE